MKTYSDILDRLQELPIDLFELSGTLEYSRDAPAITVRPRTVPAKPGATALPGPSRSSHLTRTHFAWLIYPHVVCTPMPDLEVLAALKPHSGPPPQSRRVADFAAIARTRYFYKLSRFQGRDLATPWGCVVRYGPWFGTIDYEESCTEQLPDRWTLSSSVLDMEVGWFGGPDDMPSVPNLTVIWDPNQAANIGWECCPGYYWCAATQSCVPQRVTCQDPIPF